MGIRWVKTRRRCAPPLFCYPRKTWGGGVQTPPPPAGRGLIQAENTLEVFRYISMISAPQHSHRLQNTTTTRRFTLHKVTRTTDCRSRVPAPYIGPQTISRTFLIIPENSGTLSRRPFLDRSRQHENSREAARHFRNVLNSAVYRNYAITEWRNLNPSRPGLLPHPWVPGGEGRITPPPPAISRTVGHRELCEAAFEISPQDAPESPKWT